MARVVVGREADRLDVVGEVIRRGHSAQSAGLDGVDTLSDVIMRTLSGKWMGGELTETELAPAVSKLTAVDLLNSQAELVTSSERA